MNAQDIITLLNQPDGPKPTPEELNTNVDDAGYRLPQSLDEGKRGALSESATKRCIRNLVNAKFISELECEKYAKCMRKQLRSGVDATN